MKKFLATVIVLALVLTTAVGCSNKPRALSTEELVTAIESYVDNEFVSHGRIILDEYDDEMVQLTVFNVVDKDGDHWDYVDMKMSIDLLP